MEKALSGLVAEVRNHGRSLIVLTATTGAVVAAWKLWSGRKRNLPPGPTGWPVLGCSYLLTPDFYLRLTDMGKTYGDVYSFYMGNRLTVVLNSASAMREAFLQQGVAYASRPHPWVMQLVKVKEVINNGIYGEEWIEERKFVLGALRQFGYGSSSLHDKIEEEITTLLNTYSSAADNKNPLDPRTQMPKSMANLVFSILINENYSYDDEQLLEKLRLIRQWQTRVGEANILDLFPILRFFPWKPMGKLKTARDEIVKMYRRHVVEHKESFDENHTRDVVDIYLKERGLDFDEDNIIGMFFSFAGDAVDSLPEVMVWMVLYLCSNPNLQKRLQEEIDNVTQGSRRIDLSDRPQMPLCEATVMESLRLSTFVPLSEPHCTIEDTKLFGYDIPKGTVVLGNIYAAHIDEGEWENPKEFNPDRFIGADGRLTKPKAFMPYSLGRRMCLGEQLSNKILFLFLTHLMTSFSLNYSVPSDKPGLTPETGYNRKARDFSVSVHHR